MKNMRLLSLAAAAAITSVTLTGGLAHAHTTQVPTGTQDDFFSSLYADIYSDVYSNLDPTAKRYLDKPKGGWSITRNTPSDRPHGSINTKSYVDAYVKSYTDLYAGLLKTHDVKGEKTTPALLKQHAEIERSVMREIERIGKGDKRLTIKLNIGADINVKPAPKPQEEPQASKPKKKTSGKKKAPAWVIAINHAESKLGKPYKWGGQSDADGGYDCSGLTYASYAKAGISLPRVASDQYRASSVHPGRNDLRIGDLVFFNNLEHVGLYAGKGKVLHAPKPGAVIRYESIGTVGTYYGATRVA